MTKEDVTAMEKMKKITKEEVSETSSQPTSWAW
jgi:hypothetical protein